MAERMPQTQTVPSITTATQVAPIFEPPPVRNIEETGLNLGFLADMALKVMYFEGFITGNRIAEIMRLPYGGVLDQVIEFLKREQFCEVKGTGGIGEGSYQYVITLKGGQKAREILDRSMYVGPTPVPLEAYTRAIKIQSSRPRAVHQRSMRQALSHLVINDTTFNQLGPAVNSGRSIFLYGPPGNGKTSIAESIGGLILSGDMWIPFAVEVGGMIIKTYDSVNHVLADEGHTGSTGSLKSRGSRDPRWVRIRRPCIISGGELTLESLDLVWDDSNKFYEAPLQMKANGGMFLIDDFGRQQVRPRDLLNRWIVPLEKRLDYLTLHTGRKIEIPFDVLIVFSTNMPPRDLVDEAFLRRIRHKIEIGDPSFDEFREIFRRICNHKGLAYDDRGLAYLLQEYYVKNKRKLRATHPRDLVDQVIDIARYMNVEPVLTKELLDQACQSYFVEL